MKKLLLIALVAIMQCLFVIQGFSQSYTWTQVSPVASQPIGLRDVMFVNTNTGWAVGMNGLIIKTTNGGKNWVNQGSNINEDLVSVYFVDELTGFAAGGKYNNGTGTILRTTNGGTIWTKVRPSNDVNNIFSLQFLDGFTGFAAGYPNNNPAGQGVFFRTTDGGDKWNLYNLKLPNNTKSLFFTDANTGYAVGGGVVNKTTNAELQWRTITIDADATLNCIFFTDYLTGYVVGSNGVIYKTTDSAATWTAQNSGTTEYLTKVFFIDKNTGWAVGNDGIIIKTTNAGENWTKQNITDMEFFTGVHFADANTGWIVGGTETLINSTNGGADWKHNNNGTTHSLSKVFFVDENTGWTVGDSLIILKTTDKGLNWIKQNIGSICYLSNIFFINNNTGWMNALDHQDGNFLTLKTTDAGVNWLVVYNDENKNLDNNNEIWFKDENNGFCGLSDGLNITTNSGAQWHLLIQDITVKRIQFIDSQTGYVFSDKGKYYKTTDGGNTWDTLNLHYNIAYAHFVNLETGFVLAYQGGVPGYLFKTTDGGINWIKVSDNLLSNFSKFYFADENKGWITGKNGNVDYTSDGGLTWVTQLSSTANPNCLNSMYFVNKNFGCAVGNNGTIFRFVDNTLDSPVLELPVKDSTGLVNGELFTWKSSPDATYYEFQLATDAAFTSIILSKTVTDTFYINTTKLNCIKYYWRVKAKTQSYESYWSTVWNFTKSLPKPILVLPANNATNIKLKSDIQWEVVTDALSYIIEIAKDNEFTNIAYTFSSQTNFIQLTVQEYETKFYWRVKAINQFSVGEWSDIWNYTTEKETSVQELSNEKGGFNIYPNPTENNITVLFDNDKAEQVTISILDLTGEELGLIFNGVCNSGQNTINYNLSELSDGIYYVKFSTKTKTAIYKICKY